MRPSFFFEQALWKKGYFCVIGVDEVGRGALAGPVVAGACLLASQDTVLQEILSLGIDDSKRLSGKQREALVPYIEQYFHCAIGKASVTEINRYGIVAATQKAMRRAIRSLWSLVISRWQESKEHTQKIANDQRPTTNDQLRFLLIDGKFPLPQCPELPLSRQRAIIKGDRQSVSIAAASIIAKVYRDKLMSQLSKNHPRYKWNENKGYGTEKHRQAIRECGLTKHHRTIFCISSFAEMPL